MPATNINWVGLDMDLYYNSGTNSVPVWVLIPNVQDLKRGSSLGEAELNNRASKLVQKEPTLDEYIFTWGMIKDETDVNYTTLRTRKDGRTLTEFAFANGLIATSGVTYFRIETKLFGFDDEEPLTGGVVTSVTAKPCRSSNAPTWVLVP